jgi:3-oxoacyl-(acyl-carrier-protein) synthase
VSQTISITAADVVCALGGSLPECLEAWRTGRSGLQEHDGLLSGRIADRSVLKGRRYGAASNLAVHVARSAVQRAGWSADETKAAWLFAASSRGNAGELLGQNGWRRPSPRFSASNTIHSEIAAAVSIELGIRGPWQMLSSGCSSGLDALGMAWMALRAGLTKRALIVAVDLPLVAELVRAFRDTHLLSTNSVNDPLSPLTTGLHLGEAGSHFRSDLTRLRVPTNSPLSLMILKCGRSFFFYTTSISSSSSTTSLRSSSPSEKSENLNLCPMSLRVSSLGKGSYLKVFAQIRF